MKRFVFNKYSKYVSSLSEWSSSIYLYNKNNIFQTNYNDKKVYDLFYNYLNLSFYEVKKKFRIDSFDLLKDSFSVKNTIYFFDNDNIERDKSKNLIKKTFKFTRLLKYRIRKRNYLSLFKNRSINKIFISKPEIKYSLNEVIITLYVYNREKYYFLKKLSILNKIFFNLLKRDRIKKSLLLNKLKRVDYLFKYVNNGIVPKLFNSKLLHIRSNLPNFDYYIKYFGINKIENGHKIFSFDKDKYILDNIKKVFYINLKKVFMFKYYISIIYLNNFKFNNNNFIELKKKLYKIFNKKVNINIINLKYLYMENFMFVEAIINKLNDRKKRVLKVIRKALNLGKIVKLHPLFFKLRKNEKDNSDPKFDKLNDLMFNLRKNKYVNILSRLKNKHVSGLRIEAKGRLTKRLTASRAVYKLSYKGSLKNIYSSYNKLSTSVLRGLHKSNINYINTSSKNRNGSYGIKYWSSSY